MLSLSGRGALAVGVTSTRLGALEEAGLLYVVPFARPPETNSIVFVFIDQRGLEVTDRDLRPFARGENAGVRGGAVVGRWYAEGFVDVSEARHQ
jgi:hypothetical protein